MSTQANANLFVFAGFSLDAQKRLLFGPDGRPIALTARAFDTLLFLVENPDRLVEKQSLMKAVWPNLIVEENNLNQNISIVRRALGEAPGEHRFVVTVAGRGFRFVAPVKRRDALPEPDTVCAPEVQPKFEPAAAPRSSMNPPEVASSPGPVATLPTVTSARGPEGRPGDWAFASHNDAKRRPKAFAVRIGGFATVAVLVVAGFLLMRHTAPVTTGNDSSPSPSSVVMERPRIAVLPFENLSPDRNDAFFADGMHEEVLTALTNGAPGLDVISRTTMDTYKGKAVTTQTLAKELHCNYVLEGSMRRDGSEVRLGLQLIDARTDSHVWAKDFDRKLGNVMALESEVASAVASQLSSKLGTGMRSPAPVTVPPAFDLYLKARRIVATAGYSSPQATWQDALNLLDQAIKIDPSFARAYLERSVVRALLFCFNYDASETYLTAAQKDLDTANKISPEDPRAISVAALLAHAHMDYGRALQLFEAAERNGIVDPEVLTWNAATLLALGRYQDSAQIARRLVDLDPKNTDALQFWWFQLMEAHQPQEAMRLSGLAASSEQRDAIQQGVLVEYGADASAATDEQEQFASNLSPTSITENSIGDVVSLLVTLHRYSDARRLIDQMPVETWRQTSWYWPLIGVGRTPLADQRGWVDLFLNDAPAAHRDGERIFAFLKTNPETQWNKWYRTLLRADALLYTGDHAEAIAAADKAVVLTRAWPNVSHQSVAFVWATQIRAWGGAQEDAAGRLETLATSIPGLWPGEFVRNPIWTVPMAKNARFQALQSRLMEQMKSQRFE